MEDIGLKWFGPDLDRRPVKNIKLLLDYIFHAKCYENSWSVLAKFLINYVF